MSPISLVLLIPSVLGVVRDLKINGYHVTIEDDTLKTVRTTDCSRPDLDLSRLRIRHVEGVAFTNLTNLRTLNLANNDLTSLPPFAFHDLRTWSLENLTLADNRITDLAHAFHGLRSLRFLDITNNPLRPSWNSPMFVGLSATCDIRSRGTFPRKLSPGAFRSFAPEIVMVRYPPETLPRPPETMRRPHLYVTTFPDPSEYRLCIQDGVVRALEIARAHQRADLDSCDRVVHPFGHFDLSDRRIRDFARSWYLVRSATARSIDLGRNDIDRVSKGTLNDFPSYVVNVSLSRNRIDRLEANVTVNRWIKWLDLSYNLIDVIQDGALDATEVEVLILTGNRLADLNFAATLPRSVANLRVDRNEIEAIDPRSFRSDNKIRYLDLGGNRIAELRNESLSRVKGLIMLVLHENGLRRIEIGALRHVDRLNRLDLCCNSLATVGKEVFAGLSWLLRINLSGNRLTSIARDFFDDLPGDMLQHVDLSFNSIETIETGSFARLPTSSLSLSYNKIARIERGTFGFLSSNPPTNSTFRSVANNPGRSFRYLALDGNRIQRLENGALYGLEISKDTVVELGGADIEIVQPGVFNDL